MNWFRVFKYSFVKIKTMIISFLFLEQKTQFSLIIGSDELWRENFPKKLNFLKPYQTFLLSHYRFNFALSLMI